MKKIQKSKKGFTLVEMVLVIAIIVILAAVLLFGVSQYLNAANKAKGSISEHNSNVEYVTNQVQSVFQ